MVKININIGNKTFYTLIAVIIILVAGGIVYAWNSDNPSVMGHTVGEIEGLNETVRAIVNDEISGVEAPINCVSKFTSGEVDKTLFTIVDIPDNCMDSPGCVIVQKINKGGKTILTKITPYLQNTTTNKWWSSFRTSSTLKNGDTTQSLISSSYPYGTYLYDDYKTLETSPLQWAVNDNSAVYGTELLICSPS
jgi:hypothetical protein